MQLLIYIYLFSFVILAIYGLHRSSFILRLRKFQGNEPQADCSFLPRVCIQMPVYNEPSVIERLLLAVSKIDYPERLLEIQLLDDSDDGVTTQLAEELVQNKKLKIKHLRRLNREGYKAGALAYGMQKSEAEFFAVFDADFIPQSDFLKETIRYFADTDIAFVQARWTFVNRFSNFLTRAQAVLIDAHFLIEHPVRDQLHCFNFNGTAGVWRKSAIKSAGGWQADTITEDLDLSYRVYLAGWKSKYLSHVTCASELPENINAFKSQQYRWMKGSAQVFKKLIWKIFKSDLSIKRKVEAFFHLSANFCYQLMVVMALLAVPVSVMRLQLDFSIGLWFELFLFMATLGSVFIFYLRGQLIARSRDTYLQTMSIFAVIKEVLLGIVLGVGIGAHCALASLAGILAQVGEFVRTPKSGNADSAREAQHCLSYTQAFKAVIKHRKESFIAMYLSISLVYLLSVKHFLTIPFTCFILSGYLLLLLIAFCPASGGKVQKSNSTKI